MEKDYWKEVDNKISSARRWNRIMLQRQEGKVIVFDESEPPFEFAVIQDGDTARLAVF